MSRELDREAVRAVLDDQLGPAARELNGTAPICTSYICIAVFMTAHAQTMVSLSANAGGSELSTWEASGLLTARLMEVARGREEERQDR
ncbi:MAG TPA: hypothetical protein VIS51_04355 [Solirubrobacterales bacterium]